MTDTTVGTEIHQAFDVHRRLATQIAFDRKYRNSLTKFLNFRLCEILDRRVSCNTSRLANLLRASVSNSVYRRQCYHDVFRQRNVYACYTCHLKILVITRGLALALLMPCVSADHPHNTVAANDFAVSADFFN
jgi:hypothetical protein